jgi:hypothetical protein
MIENVERVNEAPGEWATNSENIKRDGEECGSVL